MSAVMKTAIDIEWEELPAIVMKEGYPLHKQVKSWAGNTCPDCGEGSPESNKFNVFQGKDGKWRFNCFACGTYGDSADFLAIARHIPLGEALSLLNGHGGRGSPVRSAVMPKRAAKDAPCATEPRIREVLAILREKATDDGPRSYLRGRKLTDATIDMAMATGQLRMLPAHPEHARRWLSKNVGDTLLREAGFMKKDSQWPALAFKPLLALEPGGFGFECRVATSEYTGPKAIRYGRMKWPWYFKRKEGPVNVLVTEGIIDSLSAWQLTPEVESFLAVPGVNGWSERWFSKIKEQTPGITVLLGFDEDNAGRNGNDTIEDYLDSIGLDRMTMRPPLGNDWNDALCGLT